MVKGRVEEGVGKGIGSRLRVLSLKLQVQGWKLRASRCLQSSRRGRPRYPRAPQIPHEAVWRSQWSGVNSNYNHYIVYSILYTIPIAHDYIYNVFEQLL